jgi:predicted ABC-type sugar transport system permease subunit
MMPAAPAAVEHGLQNWKLQLERFGLVIAWAAVIAIFGALQPSGFLNWVNFSSMFGSQAVLVVLTLGLLVPLTAGDFDVSIASTMTLSCMMIAILNVLHGWPIGPVIVIVLLTGAVIGLLNAFLMLNIHQRHRAVDQRLADDLRRVGAADLLGDQFPHPRHSAGLLRRAAAGGHDVVRL